MNFGLVTLNQIQVFRYYAPNGCLRYSYLLCNPSLLFRILATYGFLHFLHSGLNIRLGVGRCFRTFGVILVNGGGPILLSLTIRWTVKVEIEKLRFLHIIIILESEYPASESPTMYPSHQIGTRGGIFTHNNSIFILNVLIYSLHLYVHRSITFH
jgi:hypothetical protein